MTDRIDRLKAALADRYRIEHELGAGGMATVYLAEDLKHKRKVAVKVLRPELAAIIGAERFLKEIEVTANLQHPHILPLHDSGEADSFLYYVMPYVEGESLRDKLDRDKQLGVEETVGIAKGVSAALDYAHRQGVIHRDIKPENILIHDGQPVVADFGIALAVTAAGGTRLTETGLSLGTPQYMSPEQATGEREVTAKSDVYSLGAVTYEMLVGEPPHTGNTVQAIIARVVSAEPQPISDVRHAVPVNVQAAVHKALAKVPADRFARAAEFAEALTNPSFELPTLHGRTAVRAASGAQWSRMAVLGWSLAAVATVVALWGWLRPAPAEPPRPVIRYSTRLPWEVSETNQFYSHFALSPDGERLVYVHQGNLWLRSLDELPGTATPIPGTEGAFNPFFSPDGARVGYLHSRTSALKSIPLDGGPPTTVAEGVGRAGASWGPDGSIYVSMAGGSIGLARISASGGELEPVTTLDTARGKTGHLLPEVLPNGKGVLFTVMDGSGPSTADIAVLDLASGTYRVLVRGVGAKYAASRHVVYVTADGTLMAVPFDQDALELTGEATALAERVIVGFRVLDMALSAPGTLMYTTLSAGRVASNELVWVTRDGTAEPIDPGWTGDFETPALSPDGTQLAVTIVQDDGEQLWIKQLDRGPLSQLSYTATRNYRPAWSPDGLAVAFVSIRGDNRNLYVGRADGSAGVELLREGEPAINEVHFSPDGRWLVYRAGSGSTGQGRDLYAVRVGVDSAPVALVTTEFEETSPAVSPNGRWLAYVSNRSGEYEVYVRPFPNPGNMRWPVSVDGGVEPVWAHGGRELFYKSAGNLMSARVVPDTTFVIGERRVLFSIQGYSAPYNQHQLYDVTPDDQRFVMIRLVGGEGDNDIELIVVENFFEELKAKVGNE